jgi:lipopolysaccharide biosynthesis regulator YciM
MDTFYVSFRDPLFGILVFFLLLFTLSFLSYWWGRHKASREHKDLEDFLGTFNDVSVDIAAQVHNNTPTNEMWLLLASAYEQQGNHEKSIEIYHALLHKKSDDIIQKEILLKLGQAYFKAGFLERSKMSFLQILQNHPRTPQALHHLILIYEQLQQFASAQEVLDVLEEIGEEVKAEKLYLHTRAFLSNPKHTIDEKATFCIDTYQQHHMLSYLLFEYLFTHRPALAWEHFDQSLSVRLVDILWLTSVENLDLDIIEANGFLRELFSARKAVDMAQASTVFELDVLLALGQCTTKSKATLQFEYTCSACKHVSFFPFHRCAHCHTIDSVEPTMSLTKEWHEEYHSFQ